MKQGKGIPNSKFDRIVGIATTKPVPAALRHKHIYVGETADFHSLGYAGCIFSGKGKGIFQPGAITQADISIINDGDILILDDSGTFDFVWEADSPHNSFFLTGKCNVSCLMCPQPPGNFDNLAYGEARKILKLLQGRRISDICLTGGEPTLAKDKFIEFLAQCVAQHPESYISVLTNGRTLADMDFVERIAEIATANVIFCVSLHGDNPRLHDAIVNQAGSFEKTETGIYNLARKGIKIEIRHVVTKPNYTRLPQMARHIYNYMPFCDHYAFMAMELHGNAVKNSDLIMVNPVRYKDRLADAALLLERACLPVSLYNIPLCMADERVRHLARQSISTWKNIFPQECCECSQKSECSGFFATSERIPVEDINPFH